MSACLIGLASAILLVTSAARCARAGDLGIVPLLDAERSDMLDLWGGPLGVSSGATLAKQSSVVHSGTSAYQLNVGTIPSGNIRFFQAFSSEVNRTQLEPGGEYVYRQDRDLTQYQSLQSYVRNDTGSPFTLTVELKDYQDSNSQRAQRTYSIPAGGAWTPINVPLDLSSGWTVSGTPDISRTFALGFIVNATSGPVSGNVYFDDVSLVEKGPSVDVQTAPIQDIVEQLARRQFMGLWAARNKTSGLIPNRSDKVDVGALNTTTGVVWNLPSAVRRGWVTQSDADAYMAQLVSTLDHNRDQTTYLPTRFLDLATGAPTGDHEESSIDASFMALALHNYKSQPATPTTLRDDISVLENRFNFAAFAGPGAYKQAYFQPTEQFGCCTYSGYTNENKVIALAAAVNTSHNVPLVNMWNKDTDRAPRSLVGPENYLVYELVNVAGEQNDYRAPFAQALLNLFVDTSDRGPDNYPTRSQARNPWENLVRYEADAAAKLAQLGRSNLAQPDAGAGAGTYKPWNLYNNFGQPNLFQPWSVAEMLMAGAPGAEASLRFLLDNGLGTGLDGPLGLADSAQWATGAANPTSVPSFADNWNITLSTMALLAFLDGDDRQNLFFANLPEVRAALDSVFVAGDYTGNGVVDAADYAYWRSTLGSINSLAADGNNNGVVDAGDFVLWRKQAGGAGLGATTGVPEPGPLILIAAVCCVALGVRRRLDAGRLEPGSGEKTIANDVPQKFY
jgi:hypothetical protein